MTEIYKDLEKHDIKCFDATNFSFADKDNIIKIKTDDKKFIYKIIGAGLNISNNGVELYEFISFQLARKGTITRTELLNDCSKMFLASRMTFVRALSELVNKGVVFIDEDNKISFNEKYDFVNQETENIKYIIVEL